MNDPEYSRRGFVRMCASVLALVTASPDVLARPNATMRRYARVRLVDHEDRPLTAARLAVGENYIFHYPYLATPCFLINLGTPTRPATLRTEDGRQYRWNAGVGPRRTVVAFAAICAHRMTHPAHQVSFINYRNDPATFLDKNDRSSTQAHVIYCCSEKSVYDPTDGARVLGGPAKQPLTAIVLAQNRRGELYAVGTLGGELYDQFFEKFSMRLSLEFRTTDIRRPVTRSATVVTLAQYCRNQILC